VEVEVVMIEWVDRGQKLVDRVVEVDQGNRKANGSGLLDFKTLRKDMVLVIMEVMASTHRRYEREVEVEQVKMEKTVTMGLVQRVVETEYNGRVDRYFTMEGVVEGVTMLMVREVKAGVVRDQRVPQVRRLQVHQIQGVEVEGVEVLIVGVVRVARESSY
jgi:hypothetical protein